MDINAKKLIAFITLVASNTICMAQSNLSDNDIKAIAQEGYIYGVPMIMAYGIMYDYSIDKNSGQYKGPFNQITNESRVYGPKDTTVITPNSDTPYSFVMMDLRAEPMVICVPAIDKNRYYSVQLSSQYTFNFGYIGSRAIGNNAGCYIVAGPQWKGSVPKGINKIFHSETEFASAIFRTQLFNPADLENVKKIQEQYQLEPLSQFQKLPAPAQAPIISWIKPAKDLSSIDVFATLNFILQYDPAIGAAAVEIPLRQRLAKIGIEAGVPFHIDTFSRSQQAALKAGIDSAITKIKHDVANSGKNENGWRVSTTGFGDRATINGNWLERAGAAMAGIYGNDATEALYPLARADVNGQVLDTSKHNYTLTFPRGKLPPVNAFWSVTMYDGKTQLLIENPLNRYLINSPMLEQLQKGADGSVTIYIQNKSAGKDKESNWLPAPDGEMYVVMRLYWPKVEALKGIWKPPVIKTVSK